MLKELYSSPLCHKLVYRHQTVIEGLGHFDHSLLPWVIPPAVWKGYNRQKAILPAHQMSEKDILSLHQWAGYVLSTR